jgi:type IV secretory pathway TraG/TraD family ATPase VirD4
MSHAEDIDRPVDGTPYATMLSPRWPGQRNGVLGSLHRVADAFRLLPTEQEAKGRWNTLEWSKKRTGWLFLPSMNITHERLTLLTSLWLDLLVMRLFEEAAGHEERKLRPVWWVLDEVALLQKLPKLHDAFTRNRKTHNPVVLGVRARSQMQKHYGFDAEMMLSQPGPKIFLRTIEPESAKWISTSQPSGARREPTRSEQELSPGQELEHAEKPTKRRFFE